MLEKERHARTKYSNISDMSYTMEDLRLGAKGNISMLEPGRRIKLILGEPGVSNFFYNCMLLDAKPDSGQFVYPYGVFIVPQVSLFSPMHYIVPQDIVATVFRICHFTDDWIFFCHLFKNTKIILHLVIRELS